MTERQKEQMNDRMNACRNGRKKRTHEWMHARTEDEQRNEKNMNMT